MAQKVCECGNCDVVVERAVETAKKQILDGECTQFIIAQAFAWQEIGRVLAESLFAEGKYPAAHLMMSLEYVSDIVTKEFDKGPYIGILQRAKDQYYEQESKERDLPKGD